MATNTNKHTDKKIPQTFRLEKNLTNLMLERISEKNLSISEYVRTLIISDIVESKNNENTQEHEFLADMAIAISTILQIAGQQDKETISQIKNNASPIMKKLNDIFTKTKIENII